MNKGLISIIVPIYNVEQYLEKCIDSIVNQTYTNLEIILVDDGSPDNCPAICDEWKKRDSRIRVIHKENGGLSDARNAGLAVATGEYLGFVDSDDWIHKGMFSSLLKCMNENDSDIAACGVELVFEDGKKSMLTSDFVGVLSTEEALKSIINESLLKQPVWYKLYKRDVIKNILFPLGKCNEDVFWSYQAIANANSVSIINDPLYFYRQRENSIMGNNFSLKRLDALEAKVLRQRFINERFKELTVLAEADLWFSCIYDLQMSLKCFNEEDLKKALSLIKNAKSICQNLSFTHIKSFKQKVWFCLSKLSFIGTCKLRNKLGIGF